MTPLVFCSSLPPADKTSADFHIPDVILVRSLRALLVKRGLYSSAKEFGSGGHPLRRFRRCRIALLCGATDSVCRDQPASRRCCAIVACTASRTGLGRCDTTVTVKGPGRSINVVLCVCVDVGVRKDAVRSKPDVNSTLVSFWTRRRLPVSQQSVKFWLSDLGPVSFSLWPTKEKKIQSVWQKFFCSLGFFFGFLSSEALRGKKNKTSKIKLRIYWWTNPDFCLLLSLLFPVSNIPLVCFFTLWSLYKRLSEQVNKYLNRWWVNATFIHLFGSNR